MTENANIIIPKYFLDVTGWLGGDFYFRIFQYLAQIISALNVSHMVPNWYKSTWHLIPVFMQVRSTNMRSTYRTVNT